MPPACGTPIQLLFLFKVYTRNDQGMIRAIDTPHLQPVKGTILFSASTCPRSSTWQGSIVPVLGIRLFLHLCSALGKQVDGYAPVLSLFGTFGICIINMALFSLRRRYKRFFSRSNCTKFVRVPFTIPISQTFFLFNVCHLSKDCPRQSPAKSVHSASLYSTVPHIHVPFLG